MGLSLGHPLSHASAALALTRGAGPAAPVLRPIPGMQWAVGMAQLFAEYTGPAATANRVSDDATLDILNVGGIADVAPLAAFGLSRVSRLYDQAYPVTGAGAGTHDFVQATAASRPLIRAENVTRGRATISLGCNPAGQSAAGANLRNPNAVNARNSTTLFWVGVLTGGVINSLGLMGLGSDGTGGSGLSLLYDNTASQPTLYPLNQGLQSGMIGPPTAEPVIITLVSGSPNTLLRINGVTVATMPAPTAAALTTALLGRGQWFASASGSSDFLAAASSSSVLSVAQCQAVEADLATIFRIALGNRASLLSLEGDSLTAQMNESGFHLGWSRQLLEDLDAEGFPVPYLPNFATAAATAAACNSQRATTWAQSSNKGATKLAHHFWAGTNDIAALASGAIVGGANAIWTTSILPYIQYMADASRFGPGRVIVGTIIPRGWTGTPTDIGQREAERLALNALIVSNAATYGYVVADYGAIAALNGGASGGNPNSPNAACYATGSAMHLNVAGQTLVKTVLKPLVKTALA
ncbi:hypothetical protein [Brevundimonas subvibrioides]|uniref:hypothetical protein n=1 Tax=Brevundimonas subvibrioides TaxID=74313 RepID=UPI0022B52D4B|nr:hypothetical protein [Brevundimonas subvibrioides]